MYAEASHFDRDATSLASFQNSFGMHLRKFRSGQAVNCLTSLALRKLLLLEGGMPFPCTSASCSCAQAPRAATAAAMRLTEVYALGFPGRRVAAS